MLSTGDWFYLWFLSESLSRSLAGYLVSKLGSRSMVQVSILGYASSLLCIGLAHEVYLLGFLLFCFGVCWNLCDISFNTQGIEVERIYGKTIMATFHGGWSLGGMCRNFYRLRDDFGRSPYLALYTDIYNHPYNCTFRTEIFAGKAHRRKRKFLIQRWRKEIQPKAPNGFRLLFQKPEMLLLQLGLVGLFALIVESAMFG